MPAHYIGLMSGTSLDGVDGLLVETGAPTGPLQRVLAHQHLPFAEDLAASLLALNQPGDNELHRAALAANALARVYAQVVQQLLQQAGLPAQAVTAIGAHGQTVRHRPGEFDGCGYTLQLNNPALLAELSGIDVVADFRSRDLAAGGQGAPLVPAFHRAAFGQSGQALAVLNIGGISNLSALAADGSAVGFDCGPGNALMDHWIHRHQQRAYDKEGAWAASGQVHTGLLQALQAEAYFSLTPPKSTGRDLFNPAWLEAILQQQTTTLPPQDVQATLTELTAWVCARDVQQHAPAARQLVVCGGGARNTWLMARLAHHLPTHVVQASDALGLPAEQVEAAAFAWLAQAFVERQPGNLPKVTGARGPRVLGALYPANCQR